MRDRIKTMEILVLKQDLTFFFGLSNATLVPFAVPFPELCFEVDQLWQKGDRVLKDIKRDVSMDFSSKAIKEAFQWGPEGSFEYLKVDSLACYRDTRKATNTIKSWLQEEFQNFKGNAHINTLHSNFLSAMDLMILMLSKVLGKDDASKFRKEFFCFIVEIARGRKIRWSKVINDALTNQLSSITITRKFYLNSYLVYMLLKGKNGPTALGKVASIMKGNVSMWRCYPKWRIERRWNDFMMRNND